MPPATQSDACIVVLMTAKDLESATRMGRAVVGEKLAACMNVVPSVRSIYEWQGAIQDETEVLCLLKTRASLFAALKDRLVALHEYDVPEVIALPMSAGHAPYLDWLLKNTLA